MGQKQILKGLEKAREKAFYMERELSELKLVMMSDHHRGSKDGADDFVPCEATYIKALNYYLQRDYTLVLLGDVEEFWENPFERVLQKYKHVLELEKKFYDKGDLIRIWGNHDDTWQFADRVNRLLGGMFKKLQIFEAVDMGITVNDEKIGSILMLHGHQGTLMSSKFADFSKFMVRFFWRPFQRIFKVSLSTPSKNKELRGDVDHAMDKWARRQSRQLVACGHTHQYIFGSNLGPDEEGKPCYFNTGCCSYGNGNISGVEISNEKIRLVEWTPEDSEPFHVTKEELVTIFERCE